MIKFLNLTVILACFFIFTGCLSDEASVSELSLAESNSDILLDISPDTTVDDPSGIDPIGVDEGPLDEDPETESPQVDPPVIVDVEDPIEVESGDETISEEEVLEDNEEIGVDEDDSEEPPLVVDPPADPEPPVAEEEEEPTPPNNEEENPVAEEEGEEEPPVAEETPEEDDPVVVDDEVVIIDEENDEKCRQRGNLIKNGSFEIVDDRQGLRGKSLNSLISNNWDVFSTLPSNDADKNSWYTTSGPGIEIQGDHTVAKTPHGKRVAELDSHGAPDTNSTMAQDVYLCRGRHVLKFYYYPRTNKINDNKIEVRIDGQVIKVADMVKSGKWYRIRAPFKVKEKRSYKISFSAAGNDNSLGGLIDKVRLHKKIRRAGVVTSLLSLWDTDNISSPMIQNEIAQAIMSKAVNFASLKRKPRILMLKDNFHNGESLNDFVATERNLKELYGSDKVTVISGEVRLADVQNFDLIYIINPGHPMGSAVTADTLRAVKELGNIGIVISGDDMSRGRNFALNDLTGLKYKSNGTSACGLRIDNNQGNKYSVKLRKRFFKKLSKESRIMSYGNDIDHTEIEGSKVRILAKAFAPGGCGKKIPAVVGYKLKRKRISNNAP